MCRLSVSVWVRLECADELPGDLVKLQMLIRKVWGRGLRVRLSLKLPGEANAAGLRRLSE